MIRRVLTAVVLMVAALLIPTAAHASPDWNPDHLTVMDPPAQFLSGDDAAVIDALGLKPGQVVDVEWKESPTGIGGQVPYVAGHRIEVWSALFTPAGPDSEKGGTEYPTYSVPMAFATRSVGISVARDRDPRDEDARTEAEPPHGSLVWVSDQSVRHEGTTWVQVGWGIYDAWVPLDLLSKPDLRDVQQHAWDAARAGSLSCNPEDCMGLAHDVWSDLCAAHSDEAICDKPWEEIATDLCGTTWRGREECAAVSSTGSHSASGSDANSESTKPPAEAPGDRTPWVKTGAALLVALAGCVWLALRRRSLTSSEESD